jgi:hypothetical protein
VSCARRALQEGHTPRDLHEKGTSTSLRHAAQASRAKPWASTPQPRYRLKSRSTKRGRPPRSAAWARKLARWPRTTWCKTVPSTSRRWSTAPSARFPSGPRRVSRSASPAVPARHATAAGPSAAGAPEDDGGSALCAPSSHLDAVYGSPHVRRGCSEQARMTAVVPALPWRVCFWCARPGRKPRHEDAIRSDEATETRTGPLPPCQAGLWRRGLVVQAPLVVHRIPHLAATRSGLRHRPAHPRAPPGPSLSPRPRPRRRSASGECRPRFEASSA